MLETAVLEQLRSVFTKLEGIVEIEYQQSTHEKQQELVEMLTEISSTSNKILLANSQETSAYPEFKIKVAGKDSGVSFVGIPGGHEFTSLILAILNADGKGKMPDEGTVARIKALKGPIQLTTYVSLSCENCPEVVQTLNLLAFLNSEIKHQMRNGELMTEEVTALGIQGVPSVMHQGKMLLSGKTSLGEILNKLEQTFGKSEQVSQDLGIFDVLVVGGGPAGVSAAIYTARKGLKTALIAGKLGGQLQETKGIENMISVPYTEGPQLSQNLVTHLQTYPVSIFEHREVEKVESGEFKKLHLQGGEVISGKSLIVATGAKWRHLNVPGEKEFLGKGVAFCPHCDGPFYKGKDIAVIGGGNSGVEAAIDLAGIVKSVTLVEYNSSLKADQVLVNKLLSLPNVKVILNAKTEAIVGTETGVEALQYFDRSQSESKRISLSGVFVQIGLVPNSAFLKEVVDLNAYGEIKINARGETSEKGIFAAGDVTDVPFKQIVVSLGEGAKAGLTCFEHLMIK